MQMYKPLFYSQSMHLTEEQEICHKTQWRYIRINKQSTQ